MLMTNQDQIKITAVPQMDTNVCNFYTDQTMFDSIVNCRNKEMAQGSPLLEELFEISGIDAVMVSGTILTVQKTGDEDWDKIAPKIGDIMRQKIAAGGDLISSDIKNKSPEVKGLREKVLTIFEEEINSGLASHGGGVSLIDIQGSDVFVSLSGGCQGCASATFTLRSGIERILRSKIPEIGQVIDVTDHTAGINPYF